MQQKLTISLLTEAKDGSFGKNEVHTMTRQEAIERMAKAMCHRFAEGCEECKSCGLSCKDYLETEGYMSDAEAALNALLEVEK